MIDYNYKWTCITANWLNVSICVHLLTHRLKFNPVQSYLSTLVNNKSIWFKSLYI